MRVWGWVLLVHLAAYSAEYAAIHLRVAAHFDETEHSLIPITAALDISHPQNRNKVTAERRHGSRVRRAMNRPAHIAMPDRCLRVDRWVIPPACIRWIPPARVLTGALARRL